MQFRPGVRSEVTVKTVKDYLEVVTVHHEIEIERWCLAVMAMGTLAFLATWFLWGAGLLPNLTKEMILWFGRGTLGIDGAAFTTIIASKYRKRK